MDYSADLTFIEFRRELEKEVAYLTDGGTFYRQKTAELSLKAADLVKDVKPFISKNTALDTVKRLFPEEDLYRLSDVAKMLNVILNDLLFESSLSEELKQKRMKRRQNRKHDGYPDIKLKLE